MQETKCQNRFDSGSGAGAAVFPYKRFLMPFSVLVVLTMLPALAADAPPATPPFDARRSFNYLTQVCNIGSRTSGTRGMEQQQRMIAEHFARFQAQVKFQAFDAPHPLTGQPVRMNNIVVSWQPAAKDRVLLACHYDTRPLPDRDENPRLAAAGLFVGANDGASGVALFMEMAHQMRQIKPKYGVDFVFFDGEELVYDDRRDPYFLGSTHFATDYRDVPPAYRYLYGVLVDMVGDRNLALYQEANSLRLAPEPTASVWNTAKRLNVREFIAKKRHEVRDDHLPLNQIARIPTTDIIDFDYPHWHTTRDLPAACSGASLAKVGVVLLKWLETVPAPPAGGNPQPPD